MKTSGELTDLLSSTMLVMLNLDRPGCSGDAPRSSYSSSSDAAKDHITPKIEEVKDENETKVVKFLDKVDSMKELFPVKEVSPLNIFSLGNYAEELEEYLANVETDDPEVIDYLYLFYVFMKSSICLHFTYLIDLLPILSCRTPNLF